MTGADHEPVRVCVVGSGWRFTSGISYYTCHLANALAGHADVSALLMRALLPRRCYPGRARVGRPLARLTYDPRVRVFDGVDWYWLPSIVRAVRWLRREPPDVLVLQWWTATVAHTFLLLAVLARRSGARVVVELHETQDTGESRLPLVAAYGRLARACLLRLATGVITHSAYDRDQVRAGPRAAARRRQQVVVVPHGPYDHHAAPRVPSADGSCRLLFFGTIRPYKGLEHLVEAFGRLDPAEVRGYRLTVVGETWEGWTRPAELVARSPYRDRITFRNRYVDDDEVSACFAAADAVVLPYLRSSASGPLHIAMSAGLPVVVTRVGGLAEAAGDYPGTVFVDPGDVDGLLEALRKLPSLTGDRYPDPHTWDRAVAAVLGFARDAGGRS